MSEWNETCSQAPCNHEATDGEINKVLIIEFVEGVKRENAELRQRAEAAEKALAELATASSALVCALDTCHVCAGEICLDTTDPTHCRDCSADCKCHEGDECHEADECVPISVLVDKVSAAIRAARGKV